MSTQTPQAKPPVAAPMKDDRGEIRIVSHSNLFYWWPVWAIGFILALLTWYDGHRLAIVPDKTEVRKDYQLEGAQRDVLLTPEGRPLQPDRDHPHYRMAASRSYGVFYTFVLVLVILITNVPLRGLWSFIVIIALVLLAVLFQLFDVWGNILDALGRLHIYINMGGYLMISTALFIIWLVTFLFFDQQVYMVFTPGQLRVRQEIGGGEAAYDTAGMVVQKQRNDLFRHWILGIGSGDLVVNTSGAHAHHFDLPNVLFVGNKVRQIEDMLREKAVVRG